MTAQISPDGMYRYTLWRTTQVPGWGKGHLVWVMLNPSTADATEDDPTIRRVTTFTQRFGYKWAVVLNLYAYRATSPKDMLAADDPVGPDNDFWISRCLQQSQCVVCAWGANANRDRVLEFLNQVEYLPSIQLRCLGVNANGSPKHPLYVPGNTELQQWSLT
jgi:hypothetical protein